MKCLILAGGKGERLWPLSRTNYPKQFIQVRQNHSSFQDTIARNIPFCDEFIIVTNFEYRFIIADQMRAFQGISYRCVYEEIPRRTNASVVLSSMMLQPSEYVFVVSSDLLIEADNGYRDAILEAKKRASEGNICIFTVKEEESDFSNKYGYISGLNDELIPDRYIEKPGSRDLLGDDIYRNLGMMLYRTGDLLNEIRRIDPEVWELYKKSFSERRFQNGDLMLHKDLLERLPAVSVEHFILENTDKLCAVASSFTWNELTDLEDLALVSDNDLGTTVISDSEGSIVINDSLNRAVVVNGVEDVVVVNTEDAVYVGRKGDSSSVKGVLFDNPVIKPFVRSGTTYYRQWGLFNVLESDDTHYIRRVTVRPGRTIYAHSHETRTENWILLKGECQLMIDDDKSRRTAPFTVTIPPKAVHQISNVGDTDLEFVEVTYGSGLKQDESLPRMTADIGEASLGVKNDNIIKLSPVFRDYLWGGTRLRTEYNMKCDYDNIAEAWILSAHPEGQSKVSSGKHTGLLLGQYLDTVGRDVTGWKCSHLEDFPLLIKMIDAKQDLSVQVHPDDEYAMMHESQYGKNEMWYVIDCEEGAGLYVGFNKDVTEDELRRAVADGTVTDILNFVPTHKGDVFFIPAGTVHAIGKGNLVLEVQQSSTCTYRLYDYDRVDRFGNKRELHLDKALAVINYGKYVPFANDGDEHTVCRCKYFESLVYDIKDDSPVTVSRDASSFEAVVVIEGRCRIKIAGEMLELAPGESAFIPASEEPLELSGDSRIMLCRV